MKKVNGSRPPQAGNRKKLVIVILTYLAVALVVHRISWVVSVGILPGYSFDARQAILFLLFFFCIFISLMWRTLYSHSYHYYLRGAWGLVVKNLLTTTFVMVFVLLLFQLLIAETNSVFLIVYYLLCLGITAVFHLLLHQWVLYLSKLGYFHKKVLIVGEADPRISVDRIFQDAGLSKEFSGRLVKKNGEWTLVLPDGQRLPVNDLEKVLFRYNIGEIIFLLGGEIQGETVQPLATFCHRNQIGYYLVPDLSVLPHEEPWKRPFSYIPVIDRFSTARDSFTFISLKRMTDMIIVGASMILMVPFYLLVALAVKLEDGGPILYVSSRVGKNGKLVKFYKFRSMVVGADKQKKALLKYNERKDGPLFKMKNDPRVTRVGRIIRRYSIDELPQLINVLKGDLSLVGPRPHLPNEVAEYSDKDYLRLECIPGITCLPQIRGRNTLNFREWVDLDLEYRNRWSILMDFKVLKETFKIVLRPFVSKFEEF